MKLIEKRPDFHHSYNILCWFVFFPAGSAICCGACTLPVAKESRLDLWLVHINLLPLSWVGLNRFEIARYKQFAKMRNLDCQNQATWKTDPKTIKYVSSSYSFTSVISFREIRSITRRNQLFWLLLFMLQQHKKALGDPKVLVLKTR